MLSQIDGTVVELETTVGDLEIQLPWMIAAEGDRGTILHLTQFSPREAGGAKTLLRPMLCGIDEYARPSIEISNLLTDEVTSVIPSARVSSTKAQAAVNRMNNGDREPQIGRHCRYCAFQTICPAKPV